MLYPLLLRLRARRAARCARGLPLRGASSGHRYVRVAMYAVLLLAGGHAAWQAWQAERSERLRAADAATADLAGAQRMLSQRIGWLATLVSAGGGAGPGYRRELAATLERAAADAHRLEQMLQATTPDALPSSGTASPAAASSASVPPDASEPPPLPEAVRAWQASREPLWRQTRALLQALDGGTDTDLRRLAADVEKHASPALQAAQRLVDALERDARRRHLATVDAARAWAALLLVLLAGLATLLVEPTARAVKAQYLQLAGQARRLEQLALVAEHTSNAVMITDARQRIVWVNESFARITGYAPEEAMGQRPSHLLRSERADLAMLNRVRRAMANGQGVRVQFLTRRKSGEDLWLDMDIQPLHGDDGAVAGFVDVAADITERRHAAADLRVAAIAFDSREAIAITDADQVILKVNPAFTRITGYEADEAIGCTTGALLRSGRQDAEFYAQMWRQLKRERHWQGELWNRRKNGEIYPEWLTITAVTDDEGQVTNYVAMFSDITQKKQADETIHNLAFYDPLTELPNRRLLRDRLAQALALSARQDRPAGVLFIDLDNFKELNDTRGHDVGDQLLVEVARRLKASVRANDTVARQGGDEFVIILSDLAADPAQAAAQAEGIAEKIRAAINRPFTLKGDEYHGTPSIGISLFRGHETTVDELLKRADVAMYDAKRAGRNAVRFFDPAAHAAMSARLALESDLRRALPAGQFSLYYQMQVDRCGRAIGAEVLLRWRHPQRGMVPPADFIPLAEDTDLIAPIGHWVLDTACEQLRAWERAPETAALQLAVNVSARQFRKPDFVEQMRRALQRSGADPALLKLELTESLLLVNLGETVARMQAIRAMGVRFSIDDFGTGHSSLAYLTKLPVDQLKIDQSFVRNMFFARTDAIIVQAIIGMAKSLDLEVIAEGVETEEQRAFLEGCGCWHYQGYLFGRPAPVDEFERALVARGPALSPPVRSCA